MKRSGDGERNSGQIMPAGFVVNDCPNDIWHLDEVVISIAGKKHWLWRAVDQDGYVLDEIVQSRRNREPLSVC
jgi:hypothetical protein